LKFLVDFNHLQPIIKLEIIETTANKSILKYFSKSPDIEERMAVASNRNTPIDVLKKLYNDSSVSVTFAVLKNNSWKEYESKQ